MASGWEMEVHGKIYEKIRLYAVKNGMTTQNVDMYKRTDVPSEFPYIFVDQILSAETGRDLEGIGVNGVFFTFQIDVFDNEKPENAKKVMDGIEKIMKKMMFEIVGMPTFDKVDGIHKCTARYSREIDEKDKL